MHRLCLSCHCVHFLTYFSTRFFVNPSFCKTYFFWQKSEPIKPHIFRTWDSEFVRMSFDEKKIYWVTLIEMRNRNISWPLCLIKIVIFWFLNAKYWKYSLLHIILSPIPSHITIKFSTQTTVQSEQRIYNGRWEHYHIQ